MKPTYLPKSATLRRLSIGDPIRATSGDYQLNEKRSSKGACLLPFRVRLRIEATEVHRQPTHLVPEKCAGGNEAEMKEQNCDLDHLLAN